MRQFASCCIPQLGATILVVSTLLSGVVTSKFARSLGET